MLSRIKNATRVEKRAVSVPYSRIKHQIADVMVEEGYLKKVTVDGDGVTKTLLIDLSYKGKRPAISEIKRVSKPGLRAYVNAQNIPNVLGGKGMVILSTPKGLMTGKKARKAHIGGEVICSMY